MFSTILGLPSAIVYTAAIVGGIIGGGLYIASFFQKSTTTNIQTAEGALKFVNEAFEKKIAFLEQQIKDSNEKIAEQEKRLQAIEAENQLLRSVLQGRDSQTQEFQQKGLQVLAQVPDLVMLAQATSRNVHELKSSVEDLTKVLNTKTTVTTTTQPI